MAIDVKQIIEKAVRLISENGDLLQMFQKEPVKAIEKATGLDLPDELADPLRQAITDFASKWGA